MRDAGVDPAGLADAPSWLPRLRGFLELHIDQTQELERMGEPAGAVVGLAARMRLALTFEGRADHAGTTSMEDRSDALAAAARVIVSAVDQAGPDLRVTPVRMLVEPNAFTTVPSHVGLWLDVRSRETARLDAFLDDGRRPGRVPLRRASRSRSWSDDLPRLDCYAGHDAGILAEKLPTGMVFVRNPTGVSHAPEESVSLDDAAVAANALVKAPER